MDFSVSVPLFGNPDFSVPIGFLIPVYIGRGGGIEEVDDVEEASDFIGGGEFMVIVSSCSSDSLSASSACDRTSGMLSSSETGSSLTDMLCGRDSSDCDAVEPLRRQSLRRTSRLSVNDHSSVNVQVRLRGVVPVGISSLAP